MIDEKKEPPNSQKRSCKTEKSVYDTIVFIQDKLGAYLSKITAADLSETQSLEVGKYLTVLSDFERMSDHAKNIGEAATEINEKKLLFSEAAEKELSRLEDAIQEAEASVQEVQSRLEESLVYVVKMEQELALAQARCIAAEQPSFRKKAG